MLPQASRSPALAALLFLIPILPAGAEEAHLGAFFARLDSLGLETRWVRALRGRISVRLFDQGEADMAEAQWGYIRRILWIPRTFAVKGSSRVRHDLDSVKIDTLIHELTHAANSVAADPKARPGTPEREHADGLAAIAADLTLDPRHENIVGVPRYPRFKADEVMGYFMGASIGEVADTAADLVRFNTSNPGLGRRELGEQAWARGELFLPAPAAVPEWQRNLAGRRFGKKRMDRQAWFEGTEIPWDDRGRSAVKDRIYAHALGLAPPADAAALAVRLNATQGAWIEGERQKVAAARRAHAGAVAGPEPSRRDAPAAPGDADALLGQTE